MRTAQSGLARAMRKASLRGYNVPAKARIRAKSMFFGDPIDIRPEDVSGALTDPSAAAEVAEDALINAHANDAEAAARLQAYDEMSTIERAAVTKVPPLAVWNAQVIVDPVLGRILASNLNYTLQKALIDYPFAGFVKTGQLATPGTLEVEITAADLASGAGYKCVPFFRFVISASTLNARPGGNYSISVVAESDSGAAIATPVYSFQRRSATEAVVGVYVPFSVIATRALPVLPVFGTDGTTPKTVKIIVEGMTLDEMITITVPGYATSELREIAQMYNLPSGVIM